MVVIVAVPTAADNTVVVATKRHSLHLGATTTTKPTTICFYLDLARFSVRFSDNR